MEIYELSDTLIHIPVDLRAEVIAREIIAEGLFLLGDTHIAPEGIFRRAYSREVSDLAEGSGIGEKVTPSVRINTRREAIPDMLPPGIVYQPVINREERTSDVMIEEAEIHSTEFRHARTFFMPIDIEFGRQRIALEQFEHDSVTDTYAHFSKELYSYLWSDLKLSLTDRQKALLLELTIHAHQMGGDYEKCSYYFEKILDQKIHIRFDNETNYVTDKITGLGNVGSSILGADWIPFEQYTDYHCVNIMVGPVPMEDMIHFRQHEPFGNNYLILRFLCDLLLPVEISWNMVLLPSEGSFQINRKAETGVLGYTTILGL